MARQTLNGSGANLLRFEVASRFFGDLFPARKTDIKALFTNGLSHVSKVNFIRLKGSEFADLLPDRRQSISLEAIHTDEAVEDSVLTSGTLSQGGRVRAHGKRVSIGDLLTAGLVREGDQWRLSTKGEVVWGRIESNGQLEVNGEGHGNPSKAFQAGTGLPGNGWHYWHYRADNGEWQRIDALRSEYRRKVERVNLTLVQDAKPDTA